MRPRSRIVLCVVFWSFPISAAVEFEQQEVQDMQKESTQIVSTSALPDSDKCSRENTLLLENTPAKSRNIVMTKKFPDTRDLIGAEDIDIEIISDTRWGHGFLATALYAWQHHLALSIKPDHIWIMVLQGIAKHVNKYSERLRSAFVSHSGQNELLIVRDDFELSWPGCLKNDWGSCIKEWTSMIRENVSPEISPLLCEEEGLFTTTTSSEYLAACATVMDMCKKFFTYRVHTECGFPAINLQGEVSDWEKLQIRVLEIIEKTSLEDFGIQWSNALVSVLKRFIQTAKLIKEHEIEGKLVSVPHDLERFWNSMIKMKSNGFGSGSTTFYNGWINIFFPYVGSEYGETENEHCIPYGSNFYDGLEWDEFPKGECEVPVDWSNPATTKKLTLRAGFIGGKVKSVEGGLTTVEPVVTWYLKETAIK